MSVKAAPQTVDVLVIGGGSAALCAVIAARRSGASVRLVEQAPAALRGGNTRHARNFRLAHDRPTPHVPGEYSEEAFLDDLVRVTRGATDERLARLLIRGSATIATWLDDNGVRLQNSANGPLPYSRRTAFFLGGGKAMINALYATATKLGVAIRYDSEVVGLAFEDDRACEVGVLHGGEIERVVAGAVVVCSGGHQANLDWLREDIGAAADGFMVRGTPYATGSVLRLLLDAGVKPVGNPSPLPPGCGRRPRAKIRRWDRHPHHGNPSRHRRRPQWHAISRRGRGRRQDPLRPMGYAHRRPPGSNCLSDHGCGRPRSRLAGRTATDPGRHHRHARSKAAARPHRAGIHGTKLQSGNR